MAPKEMRWVLTRLNSLGAKMAGLSPKCYTVSQSQRVLHCFISKMLLITSSKHVCAHPSAHSAWMMKLFRCFGEKFCAFVFLGLNCPLLNSTQLPRNRGFLGFPGGANRVLNRCRTDVGQVFNRCYLKTCKILIQMSDRCSTGVMFLSVNYYNGTKWRQMVWI